MSKKKKKAHKKFEVSWAPTNTSKMTVEEMVELANQWRDAKKEYKELLDEIKKALRLIEVAKGDLIYSENSKTLRIFLVKDHGAEKAEELIKSYITEDTVKLQQRKEEIVPLLNKKSELKEKLNILQEKMEIKVVKTNG